MAWIRWYSVTFGDALKNVTLYSFRSNMNENETHFSLSKLKKKSCSFHIVTIEVMRYFKFMFSNKRNKYQLQSETTSFHMRMCDKSDYSTSNIDYKNYPIYNRERKKNTMQKAHLNFNRHKYTFHVSVYLQSGKTNFIQFSCRDWCAPPSTSVMCFINFFCCCSNW